MNTRAPLLVGLVLLASIGSLTYFFAQTSKDTLDEASTYLLCADFADASGIRAKTRVQVSGLDVGKIVNISHVRDAKTGKLLARVQLRISKEVPAYANAQVRKMAESLLGDFRLDLDPGDPSRPPLGDGGVIGDVHTLSDIDEIKEQLVEVSHNINTITKSLSHVLGGAKGEGSLNNILQHIEHATASIAHMSRSLEKTIVGNDTVIEQIILDVGHLTQALAQISRPGGDLLTTTHALASIGQKVDHMVDTIQSLLGDESSDSDNDSMRSAMTNLSESLRNVSDITRKVDEGQGTLGRLVNDPAIADRVEETLTSANQIIGSIAGLETRIELRTEYGVPFSGTNSQIQPSIKNTLGLWIMPKPDKFYILEAISDPRGRQTRSLTTAALGGTQITADETVISFNQLKFSAEFAKRYAFATLRFGIIENTGGLGLNLHFMNEKAEFRADAFDFDRRDPKDLRTIFPRLRFVAMYEVINHIRIQGGFDDPFNKNLKTWFLGGVMRFTDEDLKGLLAIAPKP